VAQPFAFWAKAGDVRGTWAGGPFKPGVGMSGAVRWLHKAVHPSHEICVDKSASPSPQDSQHTSRCEPSATYRLSEQISVISVLERAFGIDLPLFATSLLTVQLRAGVSASFLRFPLR